MPFLKKLDRAYDWLLSVMLYLAAAYLGFMLLLVVYIVLFRTFSWDYSPFAFTLIEYGFIYILMLGAPRLVRDRGHVYIEIVTAAVSERNRSILSRTVCFIAFVICAVLAYFFYEMVLVDIARGQFDELRGDQGIPRWVVIASFPVGFGLMGIEFLRYVFAKETFHTGEAGVHE